ncbi:hypothetical protein XA68_10936 [Ophiocordyceps unilateralis]|uniref:Uncharacterized protein n=1 Tax=Ophiocordyceps unilateralis TaxID=268505 RepID=A0A2A9P2C1_OPHUN|nr:hypothetical protein XA68_10936 [Ophiocordyceps unilateralis]
MARGQKRQRDDSGSAAGGAQAPSASRPRTASGNSAGNQRPANANPAPVATPPARRPAPAAATPVARTAAAAASQAASPVTPSTTASQTDPGIPCDMPCAPCIQRLAGKRVQACSLPTIGSGTKCIACRGSRQPCKPIKGDAAIAAAKALASAIKDKLEGSAFETVAQSARRALAVARRDQRSAPAMPAIIATTGLASPSERRRADATLNAT